MLGRPWGGAGCRAGLVATLSSAGVLSQLSLGQFGLGYSAVGEIALGRGRIARIGIRVQRRRMAFGQARQPIG